MDEQRQAETFNGSGVWDTARKTRALRAVLAKLYCHDSHGTDIEHFWPKALYPERMFRWLNFLLCCAECGRFKGDRFPLDNGEPLLVDPTTEDPWEYLDFDPTTGNLVARFELDRNDWSAKGQATVHLLQLDRREALAAGYQHTFRRLSALVEECLATGAPAASDLPQRLRERDDHGLLGWCLNGAGRNLPPFTALRHQRPALWQACVDALAEPTN